MQLPKRKEIRLKNYDYSQNGAYFITICVNKGHHLLWQNPIEALMPMPESSSVRATFGRPQIENEILPLSPMGKIIEAEIHKIASIYDNVQIDKYVIMPNHIHMIISLQPARAADGHPPTISRIMQQFKGAVTKHIGFSIWHKQFHDHIIRNEDEYWRIWEYIHANPLRWQEDCFYK